MHVQAWALAAERRRRAAPTAGGKTRLTRYREPMASMSSEGILRAVAVVGYPDGPTWSHQWFKTSLYLGRLRQVYRADPINSIDLMAIVDAFMISCAHMWDAFKSDPGLPSVKEQDVDEAMNESASLRMCRDYANTTKHLKRRNPRDIEASVIEAGSKGTGNFVTIGYGPTTSPRESTVDALELANASYAAWQGFMEHHGIEEPTAVTADLLNPPTAGP
jgi:hypothetical protein